MMDSALSVCIDFGRAAGNCALAEPYYLLGYAILGILFYCPSLHCGRPQESTMMGVPMSRFGIWTCHVRRT